MATRARRRGRGVEPEELPPLPAGAPFLMSRSQVAQAVGVSIRKLNALIAEGAFPGASTTAFGRPKWHPDLVRRAIDDLCGLGK